MKQAASARQVMLNVRLPQYLKQQGDAVLGSNKLSPSKAVRALYQFLAEEQRLPECLTDQRTDKRKQRLQLLDSVAGIVELESDFSLEKLREERRAKYSDLRE